MLIFNDLHFSFDRKNGTTPSSREALRDFLYEQFQVALDKSTEDHVLILGDLFDGFDADTRDFVEVYHVLTKYILEKGKKLTLVAGNHDTSAKGDKVSSFSAMCMLLAKHYESQLTIVEINQTVQVAPAVVALAHCANADIFEQRLKDLEWIDKDWTLLLHCNYDSPFTQHSDHSLNVTEEQALKFCNKGVRIVFAHEHHKRNVIPHGMKQNGGEVNVLGNQWPTSLSDCYGPDKSAHTLIDGVLTPVPTWQAAGSFVKVPWQELADVEGQFVRVEGGAKASEAADVINAVSKFRNKSDAFIVANAVKIEGMPEAEDLPNTFEAARKFDVMDFVGKHLDEAEMKKVRELMEKA